MSSTLPNDPIDEQNHEPQQDYTRNEDERLLKAALSSDASALNVQRNQCFDPNNVDQRYHPVGSSLRTQFRQRWNSLVSLTVKEMMIANDENQTIDDGPEVLLPKTTTSWFQTIYEMHTEPGRYYHTIVHLWEMFELLDIVVANRNDKHCNTTWKKSSWYVPMAWSIFFHDSIYNPKSNRNEKDSADLFRKFVEESKFMDETTVDTILTLILATEQHKVILPSNSTDGSSNQHTDEQIQDQITIQKYFLDIDMAVLGKHRDAYFKYAALIRNEYEFVPHDVYCTKRADILESFLVGDDKSKETSNSSSDDNTNGTTKQIYLTNPFRDVFGRRAKENLRDEIELLRTNTIPC